MRKILAIILFLLTAHLVRAQGTYTANSASLADVQACVTGGGAATCHLSGGGTGSHTVVNGDTVNIPSGSATWTSNLVAPSGISFTLIGSGTPNSGSSTSGASSSCSTGTVITDNAGTSNRLMQFSPSSLTATMRISCMDIEPIGASTAIAGPFQIDGTCTGSGCPNLRMDNITFGRITQWAEFGPISGGSGCTFTCVPLIITDNVFGSVDHNTVPSGSDDEVLDGHMSAYLGVGTDGDNSWAQPPSLGGSNNIFFEYNTVFSQRFALNDCEAPGPEGCRMVLRNNTLTDTGPGSGFGIAVNHGTETGQRFRSGVELEVYNNTYNIAANQAAATVYQVRGGTGMFFNNTVVFGNSSSQANAWITMNLYRNVAQFTPWGACGGSGGYDQNDGVTYFSGTMTTSGSGVLTMTDSSKSFGSLTPTGDPYSVFDSTQGFWAEVASNTGTTVTIQSPIAESGWTGFNNGDSYQVLRSQFCIDQPGRAGSSTLLSGNTPTPTGWVSEPLVPIYQWGDVSSGPKTVSSASGANGTAKIIANRDYYVQTVTQTAQTSSASPFNGTSGTGWGTLANRPSSCSAQVGYFATNVGAQGTLYQCQSGSWVAYYTPYTNPHPLDSGSGGGSVSFSPTSLAFGTVPQGTTSSGMVATISNTTGSTITMTSLPLSGTNAGDFTLSANTCGGFSGSTLTNGSSCTATYTFSPTATPGTNESATATLNFTGGGTSPITLALSGTSGANAAVTFTPAGTLVFGNQVPNTTSASQNITVTSSGTGNLILAGANAVTLTGTNAAQFAVASTTCTNSLTLTPTNTCTITVTFTPNAAGLFVAQINLADNAPGSPQVELLAGTGATTAPGTVTFATLGTSKGASVCQPQTGVTILCLAGDGLFICKDGAPCKMLISSLLFNPGTLPTAITQ